MLDSFVIIHYQVILGISPIGVVFMEVHEKIKFLRLTKDWSQEEVAAKLDMSPNGYGSIERGETDVNLSRLKQIAQLFKVELSTLFDEPKNVFNFNDNTQYGGSMQQHNQIGLCSPEYLQLQAELSKQRLINELKDKEITLQQREIENLKEIIALLKN
jgi:transcriptional regulator with XRE-family HTH domain